MANIEPTAIPRELSWRSFALVVILVGAVLVWTDWKDLGDPAKRQTCIGVALVIATVLIFTGFRWHQLRKLVASGELSALEVRANFVAHLRGPIRMWISCIISGVLVAVAWSALTVFVLRPHP